MTQSKSSASHNSRRLQQKSVTRNEVSLNVVSDVEETVVPPAEVDESAAVDVTSAEDKRN